MHKDSKSPLKCNRGNKLMQDKCVNKRKTWTQFKRKNVDSIQAQKMGLNLTIISSLKLTVKLLMLMFTEIVYSLRYNTLITEN